MPDHSQTWDYTVIGAGSAGCALTHQLVKAGSTVLVLEAGGSNRSAAIMIPSLVYQAMLHNDWGYVAQPDPTRNGAQERWYRGKGLGGSSSINGTKYMRAAPADFDRWDETCGHAGGWSAKEILPLLRDIESSDQESPLRGRDGPLRVRTVRRPHPVTRAFMEAAVNAGYCFNPDYNGQTQEGVAYTQFSQRRGLRCSSADAFLRPLLRRSNLRVELHALVHRVVFEGNRARSVVYEKHGERHEVRSRNVVLCAGALNSPKLLLLSGIGDAADLKRLGVAVVMHNPNVGRYFQDQPFLRLAYRMKAPTNNPTEGMRQKLWFIANFLLNGEGPISTLFEGVGILKSHADERIPDIRLTFLAFGYTTGEDESPVLAPFPACMISLTKSYPLSRGRIYLFDADPQTPPLIEYPMYAEQQDIATMRRGVGVIRGIMRARPIADLVAEEITPGVHVLSNAQIDHFIRTNSTVPQCSIGSCRMGAGEESVVDPTLRVRGIENLWVADASIMPDQIGGDTNSTSILIGAKLGRQLTRRT